MTRIGLAMMNFADAGWFRKRGSLILVPSLLVAIIIVHSYSEAGPGKWFGWHENLVERNKNSSEDARKTFENMEMSERVAFVQRRCSESRAWFTEAGHVTGSQNFHVDDTHLLMVCDLHKVASHQLAGILQTINNETGRLFGYRAHILRHISEEEANVSPHSKIMFVREPLERLLSAYIGDRAIRHVNGKKVSLETFLKDVLTSSIEKLDIHHQRFYDICQPCKIQYQFIGTLATFDNDITTIFHSSDFNRTDKKAPSQRVALENLQSYYKDVDRSVVHDVWKKFRIDYELFGYPYPYHLLNASSMSVLGK